MMGSWERSFIIEWQLDIDMQRHAKLGLNKREAFHVLKSTLWIGRQGDMEAVIRARPQELTSISYHIPTDN